MNEQRGDWAGLSDDPDVRVEQLATRIDRTRGDLTDTVNTIGDRLAPGTLARDAGGAIRETARGKVDQMTDGAQQTWRDVRSGNTGGIVDTITSNPIPAGMVALGLGMLFMSRGRAGGPSSNGGNGAPERHPASWESFDRRRATGSPADRAGDAMSQAGDRIGRGADEASRRLGRAVEEVGDGAGQLPREAGMALERGGSQVRRFIDDNPLGAGVVALAAGAVIGMLLPTTEVERERIGPVRDDVVDRAEEAAHDAIDAANAGPDDGTRQQATDPGRGPAG